jgi:hypothetical protein
VVGVRGDIQIIIRGFLKDLRNNFVVFGKSESEIHVWDNTTDLAGDMNVFVLLVKSVNNSICIIFVSFNDKKTIIEKASSNWYSNVAKGRV